MAPTADDHSAEEWLLLCDALALVVERCKSQVAGERLLLEFAQKGRFPSYRFHLSDLRDRAVLHPSDTRGIDPRIWGVFSDTVRIVVDWAASSVSYLRIEPDPKNASHHEYANEVLQHLREYLPAEPLFRIHHVRLPRDDVLGVLRSVGLIPPAATEVEATPTPPRPPRGRVERWVYNQMENDPPLKGDRDYVAGLHQRCPYEVTRKTIANYVAAFRKPLGLPAGISRKFPGK